ncbi:hypothetical protein [Rhizosphaericola mali]|uniref:Uncharacterized protein n=1 Tax=Rhizosphaericola mali TaxID=2545455 RepID=A0A5P2G915_9BACT|nr:hypothetical protein [Rhizosphaericola mali]QES90432.1 hypothetical protein E0W69_017815 [Rhizosphaericola mali]
MEQRNWDDQLRAKLDNYELPDFDKENSWKRLDARLDKKPSKRTYFYWAAASVGVIFCIFLGAYFLKEKEQSESPIAHISTNIIETQSIPKLVKTDLAEKAQKPALIEEENRNEAVINSQTVKADKKNQVKISSKNLENQLVKIENPTIAVLPAKLHDDSMKIFASQMDVFAKMNVKRKAKLKIINASSLEGSIEELPLTPTKYKSIQFSVGSNLNIENGPSSNSKPLNLTLFKN